MEIWEKYFFERDDTGDNLTWKEMDKHLTQWRTRRLPTIDQLKEKLTDENRNLCI